MAKIECFEDIEAWKLGRELVKRIYALTNSGSFAKDFGLKDQMRRASVSICSNIAEGFERGGDKEFSQFLSIAKGSCGEVRSQLYHALDAGHLNESNFNELKQDCLNISAKLSRLITYLKSSALTGSKYKPTPTPP